MSETTKPPPTYAVDFLRDIDGPTVEMAVVLPVVLPFVPFAGLDFWSLFHEDDVYTVNSVSFDMATRRFVVDEEKPQDWPDHDPDEEDAAELLALGCEVDGCKDLESWKARRARMMRP